MASCDCRMPRSFARLIRPRQRVRRRSRTTTLGVSGRCTSPACDMVSPLSHLLHPSRFLALRLTNRIDDSQPGADLPKTDVQPANDSGFLAIGHLFSLYHRTQDEIYAVRAIVALRYIAQRSPSELRAQFLLVRLCVRVVSAFRIAAAQTIADSDEMSSR
jgi:hypothetical protein